MVIQFVLASLVVTLSSVSAFAEEDVAQLRGQYEHAVAFTKMFRAIGKGVSLGYGGSTDQSPWKADYQRIRNDLLIDKAEHRISGGCKKDNYCLNNWTKKILVSANDKFAERIASVMCSVRRYEAAKKAKSSLSEDTYIASADGKAAVQHCVSKFKGNPERSREMLAGSTRIHRSVERMNNYYLALERRGVPPPRREIAQSPESEVELEVDPVTKAGGGV